MKFSLSLRCVIIVDSKITLYFFCSYSLNQKKAVSVKEDCAHGLWEDGKPKV